MILPLAHCQLLRIIKRDKINVNYSSSTIDTSKSVDWQRKNSPGLWWFLA